MELILKQIRDLADQVIHNERAFSMRQRLNPHHPAEHQAYEKANFDRMQYNLFSALKNLYVSHREMILKYEGLTKEDRATIKGLDGCIADDLEREMLSD